MVEYDLSHLTQRAEQDVLGPVQDDEALFLYAVVRGMRLRRVLEIGGLSGYSALNFLRAVGPRGTVFTVDVNPVPTKGDGHVVICKDARTLTAADFGAAPVEPIDLVFFDCHDYDAQMGCLAALEAAGLAGDRTIIALHDTNLHYQQVGSPDVRYAAVPGGGWAHQTVERRIVNELVDRGYHAFQLHTTPSAHGPDLPFRHGVTLCQRFERNRDPCAQVYSGGRAIWDSRREPTA